MLKTLTSRAAGLTKPITLARAACLFAILVSGPLVAQNPPRFVARFANGTFIESNDLSDWHSLEATPKIEKQPLFDAGNPVRWLIDRNQPPETIVPEAYVEFVTGDRLPGIVTGFRAGGETPYVSQRAHFVVQTSGPTPGSYDAQTTDVRVDARFVKRIVWSQRPRAWNSKVVYLRDGTYLPYRAIRWGEESVSVLLDSGLRKLSFGEVAEVQLATPDFWSTYFDELAVLTPEGQGRLLQVETAEGLVATTSLERTIPRVLGDAKDVQRWILSMQPAWSLDILNLWQGTVRARRSFAPHEVLLTRMTPVRTAQRSPLGPSQDRFETNRNLLGGPLRAAGREAGWGFGVRAWSELEFEFPHSVRQLRSDFAIDPAMRTGGSVQPRVFNASAGNAALYQGPVVVGSSTAIETGALGIAGSGESPRRVVLQVDPAVATRPPQADPLDVRDYANWLDPIAELDVALVQKEITARALGQNSVWKEWTVTPEGDTKVQASNVWCEAPGNSGEFRTCVTISGPGVKLARSLPTQDAKWLVVDVVRMIPPGPALKLSVKLGEGMPADWDIPVYDKSRSDFRPLVIPLGTSDAAVPQTMQVEMKTSSLSERVPLWWRSVAAVGQHPMFFELLEDAKPRAATKSQITLPADSRYVSDLKFTGSESLLVPAASTARIRLERTVSIRERPQLGEFRFIRFAIRKPGGGGMRMQLLHRESVGRPAVYLAGPETIDGASAKRVTNQPVPNDWQVLTRDLYGDFGELDLTEVLIEMVEGSEGFVDHVYLAQTQNDFDLIKSTLPAPQP